VSPFHVFHYTSRIIADRTIDATLFYRTISHNSIMFYTMPPYITCARANSIMPVQCQTLHHTLYRHTCFYIVLFCVLSRFVPTLYLTFSK
jgi:lipid II:glycine glycyltransferase (peptidoglycan interpeptide bridge formation enzyme)